MIASWTATDVVAAERPLLEQGRPLMAHAAFALAAHVTNTLRAEGTRVPGSVALLLVGGGNNGGDALHAGAQLARRGVRVHAALLSARVHEQGLAAARRAGVRVHPLAALSADELVGEVLALARRAGVWVDALAGTGVTSGLREPAASVIRALAAELRTWPVEPLVVAVDVPSGIGVDDGTLPGPVLPADLTVTMGAPKPGLLLPPAAGLAGRVETVELGLALRDRPPAACRLTATDVADLWALPTDDDHKYTRGVLGVVAGSRTYPGAAVLAVAGAVRTGLGMVRYHGPAEPTALVHARHPEVVVAPGRVQAWVVGPGIDAQEAARAEEAREAIDRAVEERLPLVLDAGALGLLPEDLPGTVILTPHAGELAELLSRRGETTSRADVEAAPARHARLAAELTGATVLLKGATSVAAAPAGPLHTQHDATPWLATAGAGDVLAGVLGAVLAPHGDRVRQAALAGEDTAAGLARLAAAACVVHGTAARRAAWAADGGTGRPLSALDVAEALPAAVAGLLA